MRDLALSRNKDEVMRLAKEGQSIGKPSDIIKNPITLEFLGLKPDAVYSESKLENDHYQQDAAIPIRTWQRISI